MAISGDTDVVLACGYEIERVVNIGYGYVYTKIGVNWTENGKIVPEDGVAGEKFGYSVALLGITALFGTPLLGDINHGSAYIIYKNTYTYPKIV